MTGAFLVQNPFPRSIELTEWEIHALKAFEKGEASADQQKKAFNLICKRLCRLGQNAQAENPHDTSFNCGVQMVGQILAYIAATPFDELIKEKP